MFAVNREGGITLGCSGNLETVMGARFNEAVEELDHAAESGAGKDSTTAITITWRVANGTAIEITTDFFYGHGYSVFGPMAVELARMPVDARQIETSNSRKGSLEKMLHFENLDGGEQIERYLEACGH